MASRSAADDSSSSSEEWSFEGIEKKIELDFKRCIAHTRNGKPKYEYSPVPALPGNGKLHGLRSIARERWDALCEAAGCKILSVLSNDYCTAYLLSESSLFVYPTTIMMKTCGTTTILNALPFIFEFSAELGLELEFVFYSRNKYKFPQRQQFPHRSFEEEMSFLNEKYDALSGRGYCLGNLAKQHWFLYLDDHSKGKLDVDRRDQALEILMFDLSEDVMRQFFFNPDGPNDEIDEEEALDGEEMEPVNSAKARAHAATIRRMLRLDEHFQNLLLDDYVFTPCGYSLNGLADSAYITIHVTPESGHSYVSFETNAWRKSYDPLVRSVVHTFKPSHFSLVNVSDVAAACGANAEATGNAPIPMYRRIEKTLYEFFGDYSIKFANYEIEDPESEVDSGDTE